MQTKGDEQIIRTAQSSSSSPPQNNKSNQSTPAPPISVTIPVSVSTPENPSLHPRMHAIATWAARVPPGSPACSPSQDVSSSGFVLLRPKHDQLIRTAMETPGTTTMTSIQPPSPKKLSATARTIKHIRSLGILRPRSKTTASRTPGLPPATQVKTGTRARAELISKHKKAKYANACPPPPLANEIALMQFADGGSVESNVRRMMEGQARATGGNLGVSDVYRDEKGGLWWDQDDEMEYAHLLGGGADNEDAQSQWIRFDNEKCEDRSPLKTGILDLVDSNYDSLSTQDSELSPEYLVLPADDSECGPEDAVLSFGIPPQSPFKQTTVGLSVLSLPSRPRRAAKHLRKPVFLVDIAAFGPRSSDVKICLPSTESDLNLTPYCLSSTAKSPKIARFSSVFVLPPPAGSGEGKKAKRRPAPLKLESARAGRKEVEVSRTPMSVSMTIMTASSVGVESEARREFVEASFVSPPVLHHIPASKLRTMQNKSPQRGKTVVASLDPMDDMARCRRWAEMMTKGADVYGVADANINQTLEGISKKKKLGLGGLFRRK